MAAEALHAAIVSGDLPLLQALLASRSSMPASQAERCAACAAVAVLFHPFRLTYSGNNTGWSRSYTSPLPRTSTAVSQLC